MRSALEFLDVCEDEGFRDIVFSMKSSNPGVAIQAYRLLAKRLAEREPEATGLSASRRRDRSRRRRRRPHQERDRDRRASPRWTWATRFACRSPKIPSTKVPVRASLGGASRRAFRRRRERFPRTALAPAFVTDAVEYERRASDTVHCGLDGALGGDQPVRVEIDCGAPPEKDPYPRSRACRGPRRALPRPGL